MVFDRNEYLKEVWEATLRRNEHAKPIPVVKKKKAATIKASIRAMCPSEYIPKLPKYITVGDVKCKVIRGK